MGASDWAARTTEELGDVFGISERRALRITFLVRSFVSGSGYEDVFAEHGSDQWQAQKQDFITELAQTLKRQTGDTIEERWNELMETRNVPERTEKPVYLQPWSEVKNADITNTPGFTTERRV